MSGYMPPPGPQQYPGGVDNGQMPGYSAPQPPPGPPSYAQPAPPAPKSRRSGVVALGALIIIVAVIAGGFLLFRDRLSGEVTSLQVGDCIDEPAASTAISDVQHQPCSEPHDGEVFAVLNYPTPSDGSYPGTAAFDSYVSTACLPAVQVYTGRTLQEIDTAGLSYSYFYPLQSSWDDGNRAVTCYVSKADGTPLTGSVKAAPGGATHT